MKLTRERVTVDGRVDSKEFEPHKNSWLYRTFTGQGAAYRIKINERSGDTVTYTVADEQEED